MEILAEAVRFFAGGRQILQGIDLELRPKEFLGIIGPNGQREKYLSEMRLSRTETDSRKNLFQQEKIR